MYCFIRKGKCHGEETATDELLDAAKMCNQYRESYVVSMEEKLQIILKEYMREVEEVCNIFHELY